MDRRAVATIAVVVLAVTAGCAGFGPSGEETPSTTGDATATQTPTRTATQTPTATPEPEMTYPTGWSDTGVENTTAALESHYRAVLTGPGATVTYRSRILESQSDRGTNTTLEMKVVPGNRRLYASIDGAKTHHEVYFADGTLWQWSIENQTVVDRSRARFIRVAQSIDNRVLKSQLLLYKLERNGTVRREGTTAFVYEVTGVYGNTVSRYGSAKSGTGRVVVAESGRVLEIETTVTYTKGVVTYHYAHEHLGGTDVSTPDWVQTT